MLCGKKYSGKTQATESGGAALSKENRGGPSESLRESLLFPSSERDRRRNESPSTLNKEAWTGVLHMEGGVPYLGGGVSRKGDPPIYILQRGDLNVRWGGAVHTY